MTAALLICAISLQNNDKARVDSAFHKAFYVHSLADKSRIEIVAVSDSKFKRSWQPDGTPVTISKSRIERTNSWMGKGTYCLLRLKLAHPNKDQLTSGLLIEPNDNCGIVAEVPGNPNEFECITRTDIPAGSRGSVQIRYAFDEFKPRATTIYRDLKRVSGSGFGSAIKLRTHILIVPKIGKRHYEDEGFQVDFDPSLLGDHTENRIIAIGKNGKVYPGDPLSKGSHVVTFDDDRHGPPFQQIDPHDVAKLSLMTRPISSFIFKNVALKQ